MIYSIGYLQEKLTNVFDNFSLRYSRVDSRKHFFAKRIANNDTFKSL